MPANWLVAVGVLPVLALAACTNAEPTAAPSPSPASRDVPHAPPSSATGTAQPASPGSPTVTPSPSPRLVRPRDFRVPTAAGTVRHLARQVGPRHGTSPAYRRAARWVERRLVALGYEVRREAFRVPAGRSWGVPVGAGRSFNVVAAKPGFVPTEPHLLVGAHLDTVPQAPGAEDNASGVGVLLGVAEAVAQRRTRLPVRFVAFGAEEPRGPGDDDHHYGSRYHVSQLGRAERRALRAMVSLDRVGVGTVVPVCSAAGPTRLRTALVAAARRAAVAARPCGGNRASDHWSFVRDGLAGARLGSTPYAAYHSARDVPAVVDPRQLRRAGRITLAWLAGR